MNNFLKTAIYFSLFLLILALTGGCGGSGGNLSIGDSVGGQAITQSTPVILHMNNGNSYFNSGNYANAVFEYQQALTIASANKDMDEAYEGLGWAMVRNGSPASDRGDSSVITTFESIGDTDLKDYTNQNINDARVGLAFAYVSRNTSGDITKAKELLERIAPDTTNPANPVFSQYFAYLPERNNGISNGMVHALLAYTYFMEGNLTSAKTQIEYAYQREPANEFVKEIRTNLTLLGLFN